MVTVKIICIETGSPEEAVRMTRQLTANPERNKCKLATSAESSQAKSLPSAEDCLLNLAEVIASDYVPMRRVPVTDRTVRDWVRKGRLPEPVEGFGLNAKWRGSQFKKVD